MTGLGTERLRVLYVEDDPADAELAIAELERSDMMIAATVVDNRRALEDRLESGTYDVVLADYRLKGWNGLDALDASRARAPEVPFILVTGTLGEERVVECMRRGVTDCVFKKNLTVLPLAVRRALEEKRMRDERREARSAIRKLSLAVDQSPASVFITDTEGTIEYVNRRFSEVTGYAADEALGRKPDILSSGLTPPTTFDGMWRALEEGRTWRGELRNRRKSGDVYWDEVTIAPIRDESGAVSHYVAIQEDVTERRWAESALRDREERFRQIADNIREVFFVVAADFSRTLYLSPAYETVWGRSTAAAYESAADFLEGVHPEDRPAVIAAIGRVQRGGEPEEIDFRVQRPDGSIRWVSSQAVPLRDERGEVYRLCGSVLDVTDRRLAQERLRDSEERFRKLVDATFDAIIVTQGGVVREVNTGFEQTWGYTADEAVGRPATDFVAPESQEEVRRRIDEGSESRYEIVGLTKKGKRVVLEATPRNHEVDGRPGRITALRDITELRALEQQYRQAQKMEAVGRLAGGIAHDFNNLLTVIDSYTGLALSALAEDHPVAADVREIRHAAQSAASLTRQLLAFSRRQVIEPRVIALDDFVRESSKVLERVLTENIQLVIVPSGGRSAVHMDPGQLQQVLLNLAVNARDAMPTGGTLTIGIAAVTLDDAFAAAHWPTTPGRYALLSVRDTGVGMDEATRARVFEPFFTTKEPGKGTGLGLASVYGIVKQNGGFVWVNSEPGEGAEFELYLPQADPAQATSDVRTDAHGPTTGTETILLAEDDPSVRNVIRRILERSGYTVVEAPRPSIALELAGARRFDLLVTDLVMPEMTGVELAAAFRRRQPEAGVLLMSGYSDDAVVRDGGVPPGSDFLQKPFSADGLTRRVRDILDRPRG